MPTKELHAQLGVILAAKRHYVRSRKAQTPIEAVRALASMQKRPQPVLTEVTGSSGAPMPIIGWLRRDAEAEDGPDVGKAARRLGAFGVDALLLSTDDNLYNRGLDDLVAAGQTSSLPIISQDIIIDEYQVVEARAAGAAGLVLFATILEPQALRTLVSATQRNRMTAIVQVHTERELRHALELSPYVIALSDRDPWNHEPTHSSLAALREIIPPTIRVIRAEPLTSLADVHDALALRVDGVILEEHLLAADQERREILTLLGHA